MAESDPEMSNILSRRLQKQYLQCSICLEEYTNPKVLNCLHSFCARCLESYVGGATVIKCPSCNQEMPTPENGVADLKANFFIRGILDEISSLKEPALKLKGKDKMFVVCSSCDSETIIEYKCSDCGGYICSKCDLQHEKLKILRSHNVQLAESVEIIMCKIDNKFENMTEDYCQMQAKVDELSGKIAEIEKDRDENLSRIDRSKETLFGVVNDYVTKIKNEISVNAQKRMAEFQDLHKAYQQKVTAFEAAKEQQKVIEDLEVGDKIDLCKQFLCQLDDVQKALSDRPAGCGESLEEVQKRRFVTSTDNASGELVPCSRLIGFVTPMVQREGRNVLVIINKGMSDLMQSYSIECAHDALDEFGHQPRNLTTFNDIVRLMEEKIRRKFSRVKLKYIIQEGYGGAGWFVQCVRCLQFSVEQFYFTIYGS